VKKSGHFQTPPCQEFWEQYDWLKQAIANWRSVQEILRRMQRLSREELFESMPHPKRRKRLGKRVLGLV